MPPIDPPGHAAYPSGHATESYLLAFLLERVMPEAMVPPNLAVDDDKGPLRRLAERIARNREVLGLHYPSDRIVGRRLALKSLDLLLQCDSVKRLIEAAQTEWAPRR
jgi:membrane-associated phospholipid phosphatase